MRRAIGRAAVVEIHNDNKTEKNEGVYFVAEMISFMSIRDEIAPIKIVAKSYGKNVETPYKTCVFSAREKMKRDFVSSAQTSGECSHFYSHY